MHDENTVWTEFPACPKYPKELSAPEFENATRRLWTLAEAGQFRFIVSVVTQQEAAFAPPEVVELPKRLGQTW